MYYFNGNLMYDLDELKILVDDYIQSGLDMESESYKKNCTSNSKSFTRR